MDDLAIHRRVEHTIEQYEPLSAERAAAFVEYEKAARRALGRLRVDRRPA
jgi:hypothetical protein